MAVPQSDGHADDMYDNTLLQYQRGFSLKRKRIEFVPQQQASATVARPIRDASAVSDLYLNIVLPSKALSQESATPTKTEHEQEQADEPTAGTQSSAPDTCPVCHLPLDNNPSIRNPPHEASLPHQICLEHSHPPSALDRRRKGLRYLSSYGWSPDERRGLGAQGDGRLYPVQVKARGDNRGVGARLVNREVAPRVEKVDAGRARRMAVEEAARAERLRQLVYGRDDVNELLGVRLE